MIMQKTGGFAALTCAATYLFGFALLVTVLAPLGYGTTQIDGQAVVAFIKARPGVLILWNSVIYILNAAALALLVAALHLRLRPVAPEFALVSLVLGIIWATLVLGAGMIANVAVERAAYLAGVDADQAVALWQVLHTVELGLGGGNEIAGGLWIGCVSLAGLRGHGLGRVATWLGLCTAAGGLLTLLPVVGDAAGAVFGLGAIAWFLAVGAALISARADGATVERGQVA